MSRGVDLIGKALDVLPTADAYVPIGYGAEITLGKMLDAGKSRRSDDVELPYIRAANIQDHGLDLADVNTMAYSTDEQARLDLRRGDVLVVEGGSIGAAVLLDRDLPGWSFQKTVNRVRVLGDWDPGWLAYVIRCYRDAGVFAVLCAGSTIAHLTAEKLRALRVPHVPAPRQRAIADFLDRETAQIDALIAKQERLIETLRERQAAEVSASIDSLGPDVPLRRVVARIRQGSSPNCESYPGDGITEWSVLKVGCSNTGVFDPMDNKRLPDSELPDARNTVRAGEIVLSRSNTGALVGTAAVVLGEYPRLLLSDLHYALTLAPGIDAGFVARAMRSARSRASLTGLAKGTSSSMQKLSQRDVLSLEIPVLDLDTQRRVVDQLDESGARIQALIAKAERFIELSKERRAALITAAVTGQIDVGSMVGD